MKKNNKNGFTLIELLVVIAIIGLLAGMFLGTFSAIRTSAKKAKSKSEIEQIKLAWEQYLQEYHKFPASIDKMEKSTLEILCGYDKADNAPNYRRISFLDFSEQAAESDYLDPWDNVYQVSLDANGDNEVTGNDGGVIKAPVAVWSYGPDGETGSFKDDITSWK